MPTRTCCLLVVRRARARGREHRAHMIDRSILHLYDDSEVLIELFRGYRSFGFVLSVLQREIRSDLSWSDNGNFLGGKKKKDDQWMYHV